MCAETNGINSVRSKLSADCLKHLLNKISRKLNQNLRGRKSILVVSGRVIQN